MAWVKVDDQFPDHPKIVEVGRDAGWLYVCGLCYCSRYLTDGFIPSRQVRKLSDIEDVTSCITSLLTSGLWHESQGGYTVHDYLDYNPASRQVKADRANNAKRQAKWRESHRDDLGQFENNGVNNGVSNASYNTAPSPSPIELDKSSSSSAKRASAIPKDFAVDEEMLEWAHGKGFSDVDIVEQTEAFILHFKATGKTMKDWRAAWQGWIRRSREFSPKTSPKDVDPLTLPYNHPRRASATGKAAIG